MKEESNKIRSQKTKEDFVKYLEDHPQERFWQSIRNFSKVSYVLVCYDADIDGAENFDTFYREELDK